MEERGQATHLAGSACRHPSLRLCQCPRCQQMAAQPAQWVCSRHQHWRLHGGGDSLLAATPCCASGTAVCSVAWTGALIACGAAYCGVYAIARGAGAGEAFDDFEFPDFPFLLFAEFTLAFSCNGVVAFWLWRNAARTGRVL